MLYNYFSGSTFLLIFTLRVSINYKLSQLSYYNKYYFFINILAPKGLIKYQIFMQKKINYELLFQVKVFVVKKSVQIKL